MSLKSLQRTLSYNFLGQYRFLFLHFFQGGNLQQHKINDRARSVWDDKKIQPIYLFFFVGNNVSRTNKHKQNGQHKQKISQIPRVYQGLLTSQTPKKIEKFLWNDKHYHFLEN